MTREEAIKALQYERKTALHENKCAIDIAIKALEQLTSYEQTINKLTKAISAQEPILDKIRTEIMSKDGLEEALEIIDKYRGVRYDKPGTI